MDLARGLGVLALWALASLAAGCGEDALTGPSALGGGSWKLQSLELANHAVLAIAQPTPYAVAFLDGGRVAIQADCNRCSGTYETSGESMRITAQACTDAFCGPDSLDTQYLTILGEVTTHGVKDGTLTLRSPQGVLRYQQ